MREILYKAKSLDNGEWVEGTPWINKTIKERPLLIISSWSMVDGVNEAFENRCDLETVCQYAGFNDKNNVKVWEWGIVKKEVDSALRTGLIEWEDGGLGIRLEYDHIFMPFFSWDDVHLSEIEIIGNKFDHPHLLKK